ncbi:inorganic pyrophosphatase [Candidatus Levyibacteriota bacterium]|nr:inorganic diphosphatase [Candidatus Levybacteria bacterium]MSU26261.1 inorganic diphosphatase [Candidatus Levybacteria bacterium]GDX62113.1 inorganic pyrophosphatase [Candidatus Levybacteria bacterium]
MNFNKISAGKNPKEGDVNVFVEIPKDGNIKYEIDKESGVIFVDRFLYTAMSYPFNYGFVPNTLSDDGDALDVLVLSDQKVMPGVIIPSKIIGVLEMEDEEGLDAKVLAVPTMKIDPIYGVFEDIKDVPEAIKNKIKHFFENYKTLEPKKWIKVKEWKGKAEALEIVKKSLQ